MLSLHSRRHAPPRSPASKSGKSCAKLRHAHFRKGWTRSRRLPGIASHPQLVENQRSALRCLQSLCSVGAKARSPVVDARVALDLPPTAAITIPAPGGALHFLPPRLIPELAQVVAVAGFEEIDVTRRGQLSEHVIIACHPIGSDETGRCDCKGGERHRAGLCNRNGRESANRDWRQHLRCCTAGGVEPLRKHHRCRWHEGRCQREPREPGKRRHHHADDSGLQRQKQVSLRAASSGSIIPHLRCEFVPIGFGNLPWPTKAGKAVG
eukprot:4490083-Prymnesium_polylepis.1